MKTTKRIVSIDLIRGLAIIGMILCANIGFNSGLPAWMFHAQTPPPTYAFNPNIAGLTWVDLVFPFFLFPMGAAFPLAMRKRIDRGQSKRSLALMLVKRWAILSVFALVLGNAYSIWSTNRSIYEIGVFQVAVWLGLFLSLVRLDKIKQSLARTINISGIVLLAVLGIIMHKHFDVAISKSSDVIIMILANVALFGGLIWIVTKDNIRLRWLIFLFIASIKAVSSYAPEALKFIPNIDSISWLFKYDYLQYLLIAIPGSIVGDRILSYTKSDEKPPLGKNDLVAAIVVILAVLIQLWGLQTRQVLVDWMFTLILGFNFISITWKSKNIWVQTANIGFILLLIGIALDPVDGGITKDYCNLSYLFTTSGMACLTTAFLLFLELKYEIKGKIIAGVGQNPMIAYTITTFLIGPILALTGLLGLLDNLSLGSPFWGLFRGVSITILMVVLTFIFTKLKLFWRS